MPRWTAEASAKQSVLTKLVRPWEFTITTSSGMHRESNELLKGEFADERLVRIFSRIGIEVMFDYSPLDGFYYKRYKGRWNFTKNPQSILLECQICQKIGTRRRICERSGIYGWDSEKRYGCPIGPSKTRLCMGCFNKVRAIVKKQIEADKNRILLNKLIGEIRNERKNRKR